MAGNKKKSIKQTKRLSLWLVRPASGGSAGADNPFDKKDSRQAGITEITLFSDD
jgi:hypothetical protein